METAKQQTENNENVYQSREEYLIKLKKWLDDARLWHGYCAGFPYYCMNNLPNQSNFTTRNNVPVAANIIYQRRVGANITTVFAPVQNGTNEYVIPPIWKRLAAELLDFFILLMIKMVLTVVLLEGFNILSWEYYGLDSFQKNLQNPKIAMQISIEILTLEVIHRTVACAYEAYFLKGGPCATPGKRYMGLIVITPGNITPVHGRANETVRLTNCTTLGLKRSIIRALVKNLFIGLMLPICFAFYFFSFNRTGYDVLCNSIVVEHNPNIPVQNGL